jgi:hypothetical protein
VSESNLAAVLGADLLKLVVDILDDVLGRVLNAEVGHETD